MNFEDRQFGGPPIIGLNDERLPVPQQAFAAFGLIGVPVDVLADAMAVLEDLSPDHGGVLTVIDGGSVEFPVDKLELPHLAARGVPPGATPVAPPVLKRQLADLAVTTVVDGPLPMQLPVSKARLGDEGGVEIHIRRLLKDRRVAFTVPSRPQTIGFAVNKLSLDQFFPRWAEAVPTAVVDIVLVLIEGHGPLQPHSTVGISFAHDLGGGR